MKLSVATTVLLLQTVLCGAVMEAREAKITAAAALQGRAEKDQCNDGKTACGDGNGCCPRGSKCTSSKGVGMCANACYSATLYCDFGHGVKLCCQPGASCDYSQSVCTQQKTDKGGVWTSPSPTTTEGSKLPTAPVFSSTSGEGDSTSSGSKTKSTESGSSSSAEETQSSQSSSEASSTSEKGGSGTAGGASATKKPKDSGSATVASWSAGVLVVVFAIMTAL